MTSVFESVRSNPEVERDASLKRTIPYFLR